MLVVNHLTCERDDRLLFKDVSFAVGEGDLLQVKGTNGSGKTTLLRSLAGLFHDYTGEILWESQKVNTVFSDYVSNIFYLGHQPAIKINLTPIENVNWYSQLHSQADIKSIKHALDVVGLRGFEDVPCQQLSEGQKRRVALARLVISQARLWILDEPFSAIDKAGVTQLETLFHQHVQQGGAIVMTTHHDMAMNQHLKQVELGVSI